MTAGRGSQVPAGETADQWWERVRAEHGPAPKAVQEIWRKACRDTAAEQRQRGAS